MINIILGVILGVIYFDIPNSYTGVSDRNFFILQFAIVVGTLWNNSHGLRACM